MRKHFIFRLCSILVVILIFLFIKVVPVMIHNHIAEKAHEKIVESDFFVDIQNQLIDKSYPIPRAMQYRSLEEITILFDQQSTSNLTEEDKAEIIQIIKTVSKENDLNPGALDIIFRNSRT
ncbi:hypothetical protein [Gracilibacillus salinarum]|uniref:Uncharacterized protein n=1 Tax=Gracilibacillus salinarum TaxID=2932255 RepID=A0ABY4GLU7_9BACI|nr:hypothetical protein [Gracilibacillus salinarum]UOQ85184.1 hypothetical protein MUN87_21485 [Gracilibacillus salinarum]